MKIEKEYNVQQLLNEIKEEIENCRKCGARRVGVDIITAQEIADVLEVVVRWENKREQKHQTLESACNFMETEDGTQTNEMKLHNEKDENGNTLRSVECHLDAKEQNCLGVIYPRKEYKKDEPVCIGCHVNGDRNCNLCVYEKKCIIKTERDWGI